jgi:methylthioribose-1-phosphate isomerase
MIVPIVWKDSALFLLDQRLLPGEECWVPIESVDEGAEAIRSMMVRGAPAIGVTAAYSYALAFKEVIWEGGRSKNVCEKLLSTRPTAVNLKWALERMAEEARVHFSNSEFSVEVCFGFLSERARAIHDEDVLMNHAIGRHALELVPDSARILTHCNAGSLATGGYGTATGVIYSAHEKGLVERVWVDETRPFLQGARLTAFELYKAGVPYTLICDNMAGSLMAKSEIDLVVVGSDRIVANGDVANKIGTYSVAVLAHHHGIPFYVAAPSSTIDFELESGANIPIEERSKSELGICHGVRIAPELESIYNPGFDVTPNHLVTGIITEKGVFRAPYEKSLKANRPPA